MNPSWVRTMSVPADRDVGAEGCLDNAHLGAVLGAAPDEVHRNDAIGKDPPLTVDVREKAVERPEPLGEPALENIPLARAHEPRNDVDRDDALLRALLPVDRKGDPLVEKRPLGSLLQLQERIPRHFLQRTP